MRLRGRPPSRSDLLEAAALLAVAAIVAALLTAPCGWFSVRDASPACGAAP